MDRFAVARALLDYGRELEAAGDAQVGGAFTGIDAADRLLAQPNAFLIGVLFTQGIPAERAWMGPYLLRERLGTLDLSFLDPGEPELQKGYLFFDSVKRPYGVAAAAQPTVEELGLHYYLPFKFKERTLGYLGKNCAAASIR